MASLVIFEPDLNEITPASLAALNAALQLGAPISVVISGRNISRLAADLSRLGFVQKIYWLKSNSVAETLPENFCAGVEDLLSEYSNFIFAVSSWAKAVLGRLAAQLDSQPVTDVIEIISKDTFIRPIYAGNALEIVQTFEPQKILAIRASHFANFQAPELAANPNLEVIELAIAVGCPQISIVAQQVSQLNRPDLAAAHVVVAGGRSLITRENFKALIEGLADQLGAAVGATRAAVEAGFLSNDYQIGQTGKVIAPKIYLAIGISGAIQHLAGIKDSEIIIAINNDPQAPIFEAADYYLQADLFGSVPELIQSLKDLIKYQVTNLGIN